MASDDVDSANEVRESETVVTPEMEDYDTTGDEFSPFDELAEAFKPSAILKVTAADGMPTNSTSNGGGSDIPPLSPETLVCMEDTSSFVHRDEYSRILATYPPERVERRPNGRYYLKELSQEDRDVLVHESGDWNEVFPIRPRCEHYVRQMAMFDYNASSKVHLRLCSARRTTEGTFMTVRDSAMWACSMREPRDFLTEESCLDAFDRLKVEQGKNRENFSIFKKE